MIQQNSQPTKFTIQTMQGDIERVSTQREPLSSLSPSELSKKQILPSPPPKPPLANQNIPQKHLAVNRISEANNLLKEGWSLFKGGDHMDALEKFEQAIKLPASWWLKYKINRAIKNCKKTIVLLEKERNEKQKKLETQLKRQMDEKIEKEITIKQEEPIAIIDKEIEKKEQQEIEKEKIEKQKLQQELEQRAKTETKQQDKIKELTLEIQKTKEIMTQKNQQIEMEAEAKAIEIIAHKEAEQQIKIKELEQKLRQEKEIQATLEQRIKQQTEREREDKIEISAIKSAKEAEIKSKAEETEKQPTKVLPIILTPIPIIPTKPIVAPPQQKTIIPPVPPTVIPSPVVATKKAKVFKFARLFSTRTIIFALIVLLLSSGGIYWLNFRKIDTQPQPPELIEPLQPAVSPSPIFKVESSETILLPESSDGSNLTSKLEKISNNEQKIGEFKQIILEKENTNIKQYISLIELSKILGIDELPLPKCKDNVNDTNQRCISEQTISGEETIDTQQYVSLIDDQIDANNYMFFIYGQREISQNPFEAGKGRNRLGIIVKSTETRLKSFEENIQKISSVLLLNKKRTANDNLTFQENTYRNITIRYINLADKYLSIDYAIVNNNLIITTSQESMYAAIDRTL